MFAPRNQTGKRKKRGFCLKFVSMRASSLAWRAGLVLFCSLFCGSVCLWLRHFRAVRRSGEGDRERERLRRCVLSGVVFAFLRIEKAPLLRTRVSFTLAWLGLNGIAVEALHRLCTFGCVLSAAEFELRASMCV